MDQAKKANIIVVKKKKVVSHGGHHGGAWKVAFADFAIAMMAFFLVLWLKDAATIQEKQAISQYFTDPVGYLEGGARYVVDLGGRTAENQVTPYNPKQELDSLKESGEEYDAEAIANLSKKLEDKKFRELAQALQTRIENDEHLKKYKDQVIMGITSEGLQIQIVDKESRPMFDSGSDEIKSYAEEIINALGETIASLPNSVTISGHTDATPYIGRKDYSNWELSADRANAARRILQHSGVNNEQIAQVVGYGPTKLYDKQEPKNPINRRISVVVLNRQTELEMGIEKQPDMKQPEQKLDSVPVKSETKQPDLSDPVESFRLQQQRRLRSNGKSQKPESQPAKPTRDDFFQDVQLSPTNKQVDEPKQNQLPKSAGPSDSPAALPTQESINNGPANKPRASQDVQGSSRSNTAAAKPDDNLKQAPPSKPAEKPWWED